MKAYYAMKVSPLEQAIIESIQHPNPNTVMALYRSHKLTAEADECIRFTLKCLISNGILDWSGGDLGVRLRCFDDRENTIMNTTILIGEDKPLNMDRMDGVPIIDSLHPDEVIKLSEARAIQGRFQLPENLKSPDIPIYRFGSTRHRILHYLAQEWKATMAKIMHDCAIGGLYDTGRAMDVLIQQGIVERIDGDGITEFLLPDKHRANVDALVHPIQPDDNMPADVAEKLEQARQKQAELDEQAEQQSKLQIATSA